MRTDNRNSIACFAGGRYTKRMIPPFRTTFNRLTRQLLSKRSRLYYYTWGALAMNAENPDHYDSNIATWENVEHPENTLTEVERVYREFGMTPRIRLTEYSTPDTLADFLRHHNYININEEDASARIMRWKHTPTALPALPPEVTIRKATPEDVEGIAHIQFDTSILGEWAYRYLTYGLHDKRITYFLAEVEGVPAATLALGQTKTLALIDDVTTAFDYRGRGLAGWLLQYAEHYATSDIMLEVIMENAQRLYERHGFEVVGTILDSRWVPHVE